MIDAPDSSYGILLKKENDIMKIKINANIYFSLLYILNYSKLLTYIDKKFKFTIP